MIARLKKKNLHTWLPGYVASWPERLLRRRLKPRHLLFAFCDHYEPLHGGVSAEHGERRVIAWQEQYPKMADRYRDVNGRPPRHSFFFPGEQYAPSYLDRLAALCRAGYGEVEVHLHHDGDTRETLRRDLVTTLANLSSHGHLTRGADGKPRYAFIHGNWCLANAREDGRWCGVDDEIPLLFETGCYADFTFPSAPDECQPNIVNRIYWPKGQLGLRRAYERGESARVGTRYDDRILMIEGPIALSPKRGWRGLRIESSAITAKDPATYRRVQDWFAQRIAVDGQHDWIFVKVHTHGAPDSEAASLLGRGGEALHDALARVCGDEALALHYVSAREMYNVARAAMDGRTGEPSQYFDYALPRPPVLG